MPPQDFGALLLRRLLLKFAEVCKYPKKKKRERNEKVMNNIKMKEDKRNGRFNRK